MWEWAEAFIAAACIAAFVVVGTYLVLYFYP